MLTRPPQTIKLKLSDLQMFKCRLTHEDSTRVPLLAPFAIDVRLIRIGDASTTNTVTVEGDTNIVLSYQDFTLYMAITNTWFEAIRSIKVPTGAPKPSVGFIDASQKVVVQAASPLTRARGKGTDAIKALEEAAAGEERVVKEALLLQTGALDLTLINDCYGSGSDRVRRCVDVP